MRKMNTKRAINRPTALHLDIGHPNAFSDTSASNTPGSEDRSPRAIEWPSSASQQSNNDDPFDPSNFPPLSNQEIAVVEQSQWPEQPRSSAEQPRSRHPSESSNSSLTLSNEFTNCNTHRQRNEFFCCDCSREICKECAPVDHYDHNYRPALTCIEIARLYSSRRPVISECKAKYDNRMENVRSKTTAAIAGIQGYFKKVQDAVNDRKLQLLQELKITSEYQNIMLKHRSEDLSKLLDSGDGIMSEMAEGCKSRNADKINRASRAGTKLLEVSKELLQKMDISDEELFFDKPSEPALFEEIRNLGSIGRSNNPTKNSGSMSSSWNNVGASCWNSNSNFGSFNEINDFNDAAGYNNGFGGYSRSFHETNFNYNNKPSSMPMQFSDSNYSNFNFMSGFPSPDLSMTGSPVEQLALALSNLPATNSSSLSSPLEIPNINMNRPSKAPTPVSDPVRMEPHMNRALRRNHSSNDFTVGFHNSRFYPNIRGSMYTFSREGKGPSEMCRPWGVCCDSQGYLYVSDRSNNRIQVFRTNGTHVRHFGEPGGEKGKLNRPAGIALDLKGRLVVCDKDNHRVQVFTVEGKFCLCFGGRGNAVGQFNYPWDVAVAPITGVYAISDTRNHRVQIFTEEGNFIKQFGLDQQSPMWKHFESPRGLWFTPEQTLLVTDFNQHCVYEVEMMKMGATLKRSENFRKCHLLRPQKVIMDHEGNILVSDSRNHRIVVFKRDGTAICSFGTPGNRPGQLDRPSGLAITPAGHVVVVDFGNTRMQIF